MDSETKPELNQSDPAALDALKTGAGPPAPEAVTQPSAAVNAPEKKVEETVPASTDPPTGAADLSSSEPKLLQLKKLESLKRDRDETNDGEGPVSDVKRKRAAADHRLRLINVDEDPDEKTATTDLKDPNWPWPAYDQLYDPLGNIYFAKRGKAPKLVINGFPFQVIYRHARDTVLWPDTAFIKLKSPQLLAILSEYLPEEKDLQYLEKVDLDCRRVYVILEKLQTHQFHSSNAADGMPSTVSAVLSTTTQNNGSSISQSDHNGASNGHASRAIESSEKLHSKDLVSPLEEEKSQGVAAPAAGESVMEEGRLHLHHLVRFLEKEYAVVAVRKQHMAEDKTVSFDMLWAFLSPGTTVVYHCIYTQEQLCGKVLDNTYQQTQCGKLFNVTLAIWDYNGVVYRQCSATRMIGEFSGERPFDTLGVRPIDMDRTTSEEALRAEFLAKGRRFQELAMRSSNCFMQYKGATFRLRRNDIVKEKADGRVMIDLKSFAVMNPNHPMRTAQPPVISAADDQDRAGGGPGHPNRARMMAARRANVRQPPRPAVPNLSDDAAQALAMKPGKEVEEETLLFAPAIVYGFSFTLKVWGAFSVTGFSDIDFNTNAFDALVMDPELKSLLYSLVSQYIAAPTVNPAPSSAAAAAVEDLPRVDPIANKGEGCIFLCYGPPGTGKTLTAESLAENLRRPLWSLSVAELGTTPGELEKTLLKILEIAAMWKAVLLLDEADVYLEKRIRSTDLTHNAMTGVFLRLLEYYRGVLFLTTNRITTFDDAFRSRISLMVSYPKLTEERRAQIWRAALARVRAGKEGEEGVQVGPEFLADMARHPINGREIRNAIHIAQTLARSKNEVMQEQHLRLVMSVVAQSSHTLDVVLWEDE